MKLRCPCGHKWRVEGLQRRDPVRCPNCGKVSRIPAKKGSSASGPRPRPARRSPPKKRPAPEPTAKKSARIDVDWDTELARNEQIGAGGPEYSDESETVVLPDTSSGGLGMEEFDDYVVDPAYLPDLSDSELARPPVGDSAMPTRAKRAGCGSASLLLVCLASGAGLAVLRLIGRLA